MNFIQRLIRFVFPRRANMAKEPAIHIPIQAAIERLYENERLTDALTDQPARLLLNWGEQRLKQLAASTTDSAAFDQVAQQVQQVMRTVNRLAADRAELPETDFIQRLLNLEDQAAEQMMAEINRLAADRAELPETDFIQRLLELVDRASQLNSNQELELQEKNYDQETFESKPENNQ